MKGSWWISIFILFWRTVNATSIYFSISNLASSYYNLRKPHRKLLNRSPPPSALSFTNLASLISVFFEVQAYLDQSRCDPLVLYLFEDVLSRLTVHKLLFVVDVHLRFVPRLQLAVWYRQFQFLADNCQFLIKQPLLRLRGKLHFLHWAIMRL